VHSASDSRASAQHDDWSTRRPRKWDLARRVAACETPVVNPTRPRRPRDHSVVVSRFAEACEADERIIAGLLGGTRARGEADEFSDVDLCAITTDDGLESVIRGRQALIRRIGEPLFIEDFGLDRTVFFILADGTDCELFFEREGALERLEIGPFQPLVDKRGILAGVEFGFSPPDPGEQRERLREIVMWFWHDLSHFLAALGRGDLWWAYGQLEALRRYCVNLVRIQHGIEAQEEAYEKLSKQVPVSQLGELGSTFCAMEREPMLQAGLRVVGFFRTHAPVIAEANGVAYPTELARIKSARLQELADPPS
jgi:predicted nucleotidyltransferase